MADKKGILYNEAAKAYFYGDCVSSIEPYGGGHINDTFLARTEKGNFVLQRVNGYVFPPVSYTHLTLPTTPYV